MNGFFRRLKRLYRRAYSSEHTFIPASTATSSADTLIEAADALRDAQLPAEAAAVYRQALHLLPLRDDLHVQLGNMLKDSGDLVGSISVYRHAMSISEQADTHLQLGHALKELGYRTEAQNSYRRALQLAPDTVGAVQELAEAGDQQQQARRFAANLQAGGVEALLTLSQAVFDMRAELNRLSSLLPEALSRTAFPIASYDAYRTMFPIPSPPDQTRCPLAVILFADAESLETLFRQVASVQMQSSPEWILFAVGTRPELRRVIELAGVADRRVMWIDAERDLAATERARSAGFWWILLLAKGALLDVHAVAWLAQSIQWSGADAYICDEESSELVHGKLRRSRPVLRQVVDRDTLNEVNIYGDTIALRTATLLEAGLELDVLLGSAGRTALLRWLATKRRVGHIPYPLVSLVRPKETPAQVAIKQWSPDEESFSNSDMICVVVPTRDNSADVVEFIQTLRRSAVDPAGFEVIVVDNGTSHPHSILQMQQLAQDSLVRILRYDTAFNWSYLNNEAVKATQAPFLVFANDDMRMVSPAWDTTVRALLGREDVGAVGARLLFDDDTIQHGGILFGWGGSVIHDGLYEKIDEVSPTARWHATRAVGAVTGAFLATSRRRFLAMGGFDAIGLPVAYSDVDYCLRLRVEGLVVLWTPHITLYHSESKSRKADYLDEWRGARNAMELRLMDTRWGDAMQMDPSVHPAWYPGTLPFRLLTSPNVTRVRQHIVQTSAELPWTATAQRLSNPDESCY